MNDWAILGECGRSRGQDHEQTRHELAEVKPLIEAGRRAVDNSTFTVAGMNGGADLSCVREWLHWVLLFSDPVWILSDRYAKKRAKKAALPGGHLEQPGPAEPPAPATGLENIKAFVEIRDAKGEVAELKPIECSGTVSEVEKREAQARAEKAEERAAKKAAAQARKQERATAAKAKKGA